MTDLVKQFADAYRQGAHGATMDADSAMAVAKAIDVVIKECEELHRWKLDQEVNWPMEIERRNGELAAMTKERDELRTDLDTMMHGYAASSRAIGRRGTEEESLADQITALVKDRDEWRQAAGVEAGLRREAMEQIVERGSGNVYRVEHDGFEGSVIGDYITREGKSGVVLQQIGTRVVHVYGTKHLTEVKP